MLKCPSCGVENPETSRFCDQCGVAIQQQNYAAPVGLAISAESALDLNESQMSAQVTSAGIPPAIESLTQAEVSTSSAGPNHANSAHSKLVIERGSVNTEFLLTAEESFIGRWDADNGIFPDVDLDTHDSDTKVSRRHARIIYRGNVHMIEDLGSTNGTFVNRGRRLLPGSPQVLSDGDEIIAGKTFLRFQLID